MTVENKYICDICKHEIPKGLNNEHCGWFVNIDVLKNQIHLCNSCINKIIHYSYKIGSE